MTTFQFLKHLLLRLRADEAGNVFVLFGAAAIPVLLMMGGAVDFARYARYKAALSSAVDAAALALAREGEDYDEAEATEFVEDFVAAFSVDDDYFSASNFDVEKTDAGYRVSVDGSMRTMFLPLGNIASVDADIVAEVVHASNRVELALVLDNTGSMNCASTVSSSCTNDWATPGSNSRIKGLKTAARSLVNTLMTGEQADEFIKIAVVPFEGTVNIKNASLDYGWLDWEDEPRAKYNSANFEEYEYDVEAGEECEDRRGGRRGGRDRDCHTVYDTVSQRVSHKWIFDQLNDDDSRVEWAGCVEMRAEPYDMLDTPPDADNPDTLFVPFLWPDEPDTYGYTNNYLEDVTHAGGAEAQRYVGKYLSSEVDWNGSPDTSFPYESGPNFGCPRPILPLTDDKDDVLDALDEMVAYPAMGTFIPTGLVWGWHALSPGAPLTEGIGPGDDDFDMTVKALVLLSDGENSVTNASNHNHSLFSAYNYTGTKVDNQYRLGSSNYAVATETLNTKTATLCASAKAAGVRLYTITFGDIPQSARTLMRNCASTDHGERLYYHAPSNSELQNVFHSIGEDLSEIHLAM
jgi:Flp pilus assembly protein TadG